MRRANPSRRATHLALRSICRTHSTNLSRGFSTSLNHRQQQVLSTVLTGKGGEEGFLLLGYNRKLLGFGSRVATKTAYNPTRRKVSSTALVDSKQFHKAPTHHVYQWLQLKEFSEAEFSQRFDEIRGKNDPETHIQLTDIQRYIDEQIEKEQRDENSTTTELSIDQQTVKERYIQTIAHELFNFFQPSRHSATIHKDAFVQRLQESARQVDMRRTWPIAMSMLVVGTSVGVITPAMPFVIDNLQLTASQYGHVVSAFALAKMIGNIPTAIAVEQHGRKPYMTQSFYVIALGVGGIGLASSYEELVFCRLLTGMGVSFLSGAATMMMTDLSTPLNRATTLAPIMSAFAAGTAIGPALGGYSVDHIGLHSTFYVVGLSYFGVAAMNSLILSETQPSRVKPAYPWLRKQRALSKGSTPKTKSSASTSVSSISESIEKAVGQWGPLFKENDKVRRVLIMNGMYWIALAGSQMTLLPLILTDSDGLNFTATQVGQVYMGMSLVQIVGNPIFARMIDRIGQAPAIVTGCTLISSAMITLPYCNDIMQVAANMFVWSTGSSMLSTAPVAYVSNEVSVQERAQAIALLRTCGDVGFLAGATGAGALADWSGSLPLAMHSASGLLLAGTAWFATRQILMEKLKAAGTSPKE